MNDETLDIDALIAKELAGECNAAEKNQLQRWVAESEENRFYYEESAKILTIIASQTHELNIDTDRAWQKVDARIGSEKSRIIPLFRPKNVLRIAASVALFITLGFFMYRVLYDQAADPVKLVALERPLQKALPDGSNVTLNKGAEVEYVLKKDLREVRLRGEAFFKVKHDKNVPFVVKVEDVMVEDIGTAFNVKAIAGSNMVEVSVEEGEVRLYAERSRGINLVKGERGRYDKVSKTFTRLAPAKNENISGYASRMFQFNEATLGEIITQINEVYGSHLTVEDPALASCKVSVVFNNEDINVIADVLAETLDLTVRVENDQIIFNGKPCEK